MAPVAAEQDEYEEYTMELQPEDDGDEWIVEECTEEFDYEEYEVEDESYEEYYEEEEVTDDEEGSGPFLPPTEIAYDNVGSSARSYISTVSADVSVASLTGGTEHTVKAANTSAPKGAPLLPVATTSPSNTRPGGGLGSRFKKLMSLPDKTPKQEKPPTSPPPEPVQPHQSTTPQVQPAVQREAIAPRQQLPPKPPQQQHQSPQPPTPLHPRVKAGTKGRVARPGAPRPVQPQSLAAILTGAAPPPAATTANGEQPKQTRLVRKVIRKQKEKPPVTATPPSTTITNSTNPLAVASNTVGATETAEEENSDGRRVVHTLTIVRDETTGTELSRTETGKRPPRFQANNGTNEKLYSTKTIRKSRTNPINRHKETEESTITYEKIRSVAVKEALPPAALQATTEWNPARKTTHWEQPVWVKNKLEAGSTIRSGANLENPITAATSRQKGTLNFSIERG